MLEGEYRPRPVEAPINESGGSVPSGVAHEQLPASIQALTEQDASPEIFELVRVLYDTYTVQRQLASAAQVKAAEPFKPPQVATSSLERYQSPVHFDPPLPERYRRASLFTEAALHIMRGSFTAYPEDPAYLRSTINTAYAPYGFQVTEGRGEIEPTYPSPWHDRLVQQLNQYASSRKAAMFPYQTLHFQIDDDYTWEPVGQWEEEPEVLSLTQQMNHVRGVQMKLYELKGNNWFRSFRSDEKAMHINGLHPYYKERYSKAGDILGNVAEGVLRDGHASERFYWLHSLAYAFNEALYDLNMHIDIHPQWTPQQVPPPLLENSSGRVTHIEEIRE